MKKILEQSVGTHGLIFNDHDQILIIKRSEHDKHEPLIWDLPGGGINRSEDTKEGFEREVCEETKINISNIQIIGAYSVNKESLEILMTSKSNSKAVHLSSEHKEYKWIDIQEFMKLHNAGLHIRFAQFLLKNNKRLVQK